MPLDDTFYIDLSGSPRFLQKREKALLFNVLWQCVTRHPIPGLRAGSGWNSTAGNGWACMTFSSEFRTPSAIHRRRSSGMGASSVHPDTSCPRLIASDAATHSCGRSTPRLRLAISLTPNRALAPSRPEASLSRPSRGTVLLPRWPRLRGAEARGDLPIGTGPRPRVLRSVALVLPSFRSHPRLYSSLRSNGACATLNLPFLQLNPLTPRSVPLVPRPRLSVHLTTPQGHRSHSTT